MKGLLLLLLFSLTAAAAAQTGEVAAHSAAVKELKLLESCPDISKIGGSPYHAKSVWRAPSQVELLSLIPAKAKPISYTAVIQFTILFEQSSFFKTEEEAEHTTALVSKIRFPRRNTYVITLNQN